MNKSFYGSLALNNVKKNAKNYIPYMLTCVISIMIFYIMAAIVHNPDVTKMLGGASLRSLLGFGMWVVGFFSAIFLFYTNAFLIKQRKKELALYNILGMAKRHVGKMMFLETVFTSLVSLIAGLLFGILLGKLFFLLLLRVLAVEIPMEYRFSMDALILTTVVFGAIFFIVLLCNLGRISMSNPIELMAGSRQGEKEPKTKWILVVLGILLTGIGYYMALTVVSPIEALLFFFVATLLVIVGTYLLFMAGSIALLKMLKKRTSFYYRTEHFIAVSGMLYRMKRNAAGLASICVLSTMVLVTVSTTVSLQAGIKGILDQKMPYDIQVRSYEPMNEQQGQRMNEQVKETLDKYNVRTESMVSYPYMTTYGYEKGGAFIPSEQFSPDKELIQLYFVPLQGSHLEKDYGALETGEILIGGEEPIDTDTLRIGSLEFQVKDGDSDFKAAIELGSIAKSYFILTQNRQALEEIRSTLKNAFFTEKWYTGVNIDSGDWEQAQKAVKYLQKKTGDRIDIQDRKMETQSIHSLYGGLLFVGIFLGLLFTIATVLIIYYKQITEGYEDSTGYHIMQKVGMSLAETKRAIRSQILLVFFLPLIAAIFHVAAAFNMMSRLLMALQINNVWLFAAATAATVLVFAVIYVAVYNLTAREYYRLVK